MVRALACNARANEREIGESERALVLLSERRSEKNGFWGADETQGRLKKATRVGRCHMVLDETNWSRVGRFAVGPGTPASLLALGSRQVPARLQR